MFDTGPKDTASFASTHKIGPFPAAGLTPTTAARHLSRSATMQQMPAGAMLFICAWKSDHRTSKAAMATWWASDTPELKRRKPETWTLPHPTCTSETTHGKLPSGEGGRSSGQQDPCAINAPAMLSSHGRRRRGRLGPTCSNDGKILPRQRVGNSRGWKSGVWELHGGV